MLVSLEIAGMEEVQELAKKLQCQVSDMMQTLYDINARKLEMQAKLNQPPAVTDDNASQIAGSRRIHSKRIARSVQGQNPNAGCV